MKLLLLCISILASNLVIGQYGNPEGKPMPEKLRDIENKLVINHFPEVVHPYQDQKDTTLYNWKHTTSILSLDQDVIITEFGAYIFYDDKWNERVVYGPKDMDKFFGTKRAMLTKGQPYTFNDNWRKGSKVFGGWAMWYFIGLDDQGQKICGYKMLETTDQIQ